MQRAAKGLVAAVSTIIAGFSLHAQEAPSVASPDLRNAFAQQEALEKATPQLQITEEVLSLNVPGHTIGEAVGVAKNSKGNLFVFSRSGSGGPVRGAVASELFEFDHNLKFVKEWGPGNYAAAFAHTVRIDKDDNVWTSDEGSHMIVKYNSQAQVSMVLGRKPEAVDYMERYTERGLKNDERTPPPARKGTFNRPTDVAFDAEGNIYIADGYTNSRVVKLAKDGTWLKETGTRGSGPDQFNTVHAITADAHGNIYVGDRGNRRIKVYDTDLNLKTMYTNVGAPWSVCVTPGAKQYLYSGDSNGKIYKLDLDGKLLGWAQIKQNHGQTSCLIHELHCESETVIYKGDCATWTVEKITLKAAK